MEWGWKGGRERWKSLNYRGFSDTLSEFNPPMHEGISSVASLCACGAALMEKANAGAFLSSAMEGCIFMQEEPRPSHVSPASSSKMWVLFFVSHSPVNLRHQITMPEAWNKIDYSPEQWGHLSELRSSSPLRPGYPKNKQFKFLTTSQIPGSSLFLDQIIWLAYAH